MSNKKMIGMNKITTTLGSILLLSILLIQPVLSFGSYECLDNQTLRRNITFDESGTIKYFYIYEDCAWECDNKTNTCNPAPIRQNLYMIGVILAIFVIGFVVIRRIGG